MRSTSNDTKCLRFKIKPKPKAHKRISKQSKNSGFENLQYKPEFIHEYSEAIKAEWQTLDHEINIRKQVFIVKYTYILTYIKYTIEHT